MKKITSRKKLLLYGCSGLGVNILTVIVGSYLCSALLTGGFGENVQYWTYLNKDLVIPGVWAVLVFFAKALDGVIDLPLATFADKLKCKLGRRKTALLIGVVPTVITYLLFLVPLQNGATILNTVWFGVLLCAFYTFYTLTMLTYYATFSEVCKDERDTLFLSNTKSVCDVVYYALGFALLPVFVNLGVNIRIVALIFLPLVLTMIIPFFLLKETPEQGDDGQDEQLVTEPVNLFTAIKTSFKDGAYIYWMFVAFVFTIGLQLFLNGINELFSSTGLNMTVVMASAFAPVPLTLILYNYVVKKFGFGTGLRYSLVIFSVGMLVMWICNVTSESLSSLQLHLIALFGGLFVSFALGAFFSVNYTVPTHLASLQAKRKGVEVSSMYFAVQGLFSGVAAGIATGFILVALKDFDVISLLPIIVMICSAVAFVMSFWLHKDVNYMGKKNKLETVAAEVVETVCDTDGVETVEEMQDAAAEAAVADGENE